MALKVKNPGKVVSICPVGIRKSLCPSIRRTRAIRKEILRLERNPSTQEERLETLRTRLAEKKKAGIAVDCPTCPYNTAKGATRQVKATP